MFTKTPMDLTGKRFGRWSVLSFHHRDGNYARHWLCACDCGTRKVVAQYSLHGGLSKSCGCLSVETNIARSTTHGRYYTPEHSSWNNMLERCRNPKNAQWKDYGGRGITVCDPWRDFSAFLADVGERPSDAHSLDRIDVNGHYEPGNVRWTDRLTQNNNRRDNRRLTYKGQTHTVSEWARIVGLTTSSLSQRLHTLHWSVSRALSTPQLRRRRALRPRGV